MCTECGCGLPGDKPVRISGDPHTHAHGHEHEHAHHHHHDHSHTHDHAHWHSHDDDPGHGHSHSYEPPHTHDAGAGERRTLEVRRAILEKNDRIAERNRGFFQGKGLLTLNVLSAPGSGKTTFLRETIRALPQGLRAGVIVGDLATDNDAQRLREAGSPVIQITTGTVCHLEAEMVARALDQMDLSGLQLLIIENVGNLVCPASYDLGERLRVVLHSVTEGEDKPLKYPPMFQAADVIVLSKIDLAEACGFDHTASRENLRLVAPKAVVFELSARTGAGMQPWIQFLQEKQRALATTGSLKS